MHDDLKAVPSKEKPKAKKLSAEIDHERQFASSDAAELHIDDDSQATNKSVVPDAAVRSVSRTMKVPAADGKTVEMDDLDPLIGTTIDGKYLILSLIGEGAMGVVYVCRNIALDKELAIKILKEEFAVQGNTLSRFEREAKICSRLQHPNVVTVFDAGVLEGGRPYFVMEYLQGTDLRELVRAHGPLPVERCLEIFLQSCAGLSYAHMSGVFHRDIKPGNLVLLNRSDTDQVHVKIVDFGIAKLIEQADGEQQNLTRTGDLFGTPLYMSPEQCQGLEIDERSDIYALGCAMYFALTGAPPFRGATAAQTFAKHLTEMPAFPKDTSVPASVMNVVLKTLEKNPAHRFANMDELSQALQEALGQSGRLAARGRTHGGAGNSSNRTAPLRSIQSPHSGDGRSNPSIGGKKTVLICTALVIIIGLAAVTVGYAVLSQRATDPANQAGTIPTGANQPVTQTAAGTTVAETTALWQAAYSAGEKARDAGQNEVATTEFEKAVELARKFGERDLRLAKTIEALGDFYNLNLLNYAKAEQYYRELIHLRETVPQEDSRMLPNAYCSLADVLRDGDKHEEALKMYAKAIELGQQNQDKAQLAWYLLEQGNCLRFMDQRAAAETSMKQSLKLREQTLGSEDAETVLTKQTLGQVYIETRRYDEAKALLSAALATSRKEERKDAIASILHDFGVLALQQRNYKEALRYLEESIRLQDNLRQIDSELGRSTLKELVETCSNLGNKDLEKHYQRRIEQLH